MDINAIAATAMQADVERLGVISQNIANVLTPGYKRQIFSDASFVTQYSNMLPVPSHVPPITIDASAGALRTTGNLQDIAFDGPGFMVLDKNGEAIYSRAGNLHVDKAGRLVNSDGLPVRGDGGELILQEGTFTIKADGEVVQADRRVGKLEIVQFQNPEVLEPVGNGFRQGSARFATDSAAVQVKSGFQEASNVNSPQEMISLTETVRHYESLQKLMQGLDDSMDTTLRKLGDF